MTFDGSFTETDVLVIGGGAGGLLAALSAKRHGAPGTRVTLVDSWMIGRTGHTAFSNAWMITVFPDDDLDGTLREIVAGNDGIAVLWRVDGFTLEQQESALKLLAITFGGDPACTDCNRVLRLPGFLNCKYDPAHAVTVEYPGDSTWKSDDFR